MKHFLQPLRWALPALLLAGFGANAQTLSYPAASAVNAAGTYADLGTGGTAIATSSTDDANSAAQPIGFTFNYNGAAFTQFILNTNGLIKLGATPPSTAALYYENFLGGTGVDPLGAAAAAADINLIMPFNFDLVQGTAAAEYRVQTTGTAPNRVCTVQWKNVSDKSEPAAGTPSQYANFSFQARLLENGTIEFVYGPATASAGTVGTRFPNVGLKGSGTGTNQVALALKPLPAAAWSTTTFINQNYGLQAHNVNSAGLPDAGRTYRFVPGTTTPPTAPVNDNCSGAIALTIGATCVPVTGDNTNGTPSPATVPAPGACGGTTTGATNDIWYRVVVPANGNVTVTTSAVMGSGFTDTVLQLFSGTCTSLVEIGCNDDAPGAGFFSSVVATGQTPGTTLYARIMGYSSTTANGPVGICAVGLAGPVTCNPVTALAAASANNGTRANVTFTPSTTATTYTVTYQQVPGGTVNTVTPNPTASPVAINALTPNTTYLITVISNCAGGLTSSTASTTVRTVLAAREALGNGYLTVFPNPTQGGAFTVALPALAGERTANVTLLNALGQTVYTRALELNAAGTQARVDVSGLAKGMYTLRVKTSTQTATKAVVVD